VIGDDVLAGEGVCFIQKPFSVDELRSELRAVTGRWEQPG